MKSQKQEFEKKKKRKRRLPYRRYSSRRVAEQRESQVLTCHVQEERGGLGAQAVLASGCHPVDAHCLVDVLDPIFDGAHVGVGESVAVAKVQCDARPRPVALRRTHTKNRNSDKMVTAVR